MWWDHGYYMGGMHTFWWLFWLVLIVVVVSVIWRPSHRSRKREAESPHALLQRRLAKGEISPEAYEATKALLDRDAAAN